MSASRATDAQAVTASVIELSVIVPTRNRANALRRCLAGMAEQTFGRDRFEVIVVDNGSSDDTPDVAEAFRRQSRFDLRYLREDRPGLHRGRHAGLKASRADLLVFADDDIVPTPSWLEAIHESFSSWNADLVGGKNLPDWESAPPPWLEERWNREKKIGTLSIIDLGEEIRPVHPFLIWGCNFAIRKSTLLEARGFHPDSMPDDLLRFRGDGESHVARHAAASMKRALYHPRAVVLHAVPASRMTFEYFQRRAFAQGVSESFTTARELGPIRSRTLTRSRWKEIAARWLGATGIDRVLRVVTPRRFYLHLTIGAAHRRGFTWHQSLCASDEEVRDWVLKPDFMEDSVHP